MNFELIVDKLTKVIYFITILVLLVYLILVFTNAKLSHYYRGTLVDMPNKVKSIMYNL